MPHRWVVLIVVLLLVVTVGSANAAVTVYWTGNNAFDDQTISFAPVFADSLTSVAGTGFAHNGGNLGVVFDLSIALNGTMTVIDSWTLNGSDHLLSELTATGPLRFDAGMVSALRLRAAPPVHMAFTLERLPEPETIVLLGAALAALMIAVPWQRTLGSRRLP
jgi:hypothetical protein